MQCDKCNSDHTQRLEVVYASGTSNINSQSYSAGAGMASGFGVGGVTTKTSGVSQTVLGEKAAPPAKKGYKWPAIGMFIGYAMMGSHAGIFIGGSTAAVCAYFIYKAFNYNKKEWPDLYEYWQECWLCNKCGNIYHHP